MTEITLSHLAQQTGIDQAKLLTAIQQADPAYQGETIDGKRAFDLVPGVRRQNDLMTLRESMSVTQALRAIAERPDKSNRAAGFPTTTPVSTQSKGTYDMNDHENLEQQARRDWNASADLRAEFGDGDEGFERYLAFVKADAGGKARVVNSTVKRGADHV